MPIVVAVLGYSINTSVKEKEIHGRFVEVAVSILQNSKSVDYPALRKWSVTIIDKYSGVTMSEEVSSELIQKGLPINDFSSLADYSEEMNILSPSIFASLYEALDRVEEDRKKLLGDGLIWSCYVTGEKVICFSNQESCETEQKNAEKLGTSIDRPCREALYSSDGW